jgi:hypothetical protein
MPRAGFLRGGDAGFERRHHVDDLRGLPRHRWQLELLAGRLLGDEVQDLEPVVVLVLGGSNSAVSDLANTFDRNFLQQVRGGHRAWWAGGLRSVSGCCCSTSNRASRKPRTTGERTIRSRRGGCGAEPVQRPTYVEFLLAQRLYRAPRCGQHLRGGAWYPARPSGTWVTRGFDVGRHARTGVRTASLCTSFGDDDAFVRPGATAYARRSRRVALPTPSMSPQLDRLAWSLPGTIATLSTN